jgi:hypothetical protein
MVDWDNKEHMKSRTKPTCSFDVNIKHTAVVTMANFVVLIQLLEADEKC